MLIDILILIGGLALILTGANALTDGAVGVARKFGISDLVTGLTVVAFGTSAPELVISVISAAGGNAGLALGNVVGSNIFNVCMIVGVTAMVRPIFVSRSVMANELPLTLLAALTLPAIYYGGAGVVNRGDGFLLLLFFCIFMRYTFATAREAASGGATAPDPAAQEAAGKKPMPLARAILWVAGGLGMLIFGGDVFVRGASGIATGLGVSDAVIGLTIVAAGTSLPELATSVAAALKGNPGIAIGNVIGSCLFNIFFVLGTSAVITPLPFGGIGAPDLWMLIGCTAAFWLSGRVIGRSIITRAEGGLLVFTYVAYTVWLVAMANS